LTSVNKTSNLKKKKKKKGKVNREREKERGRERERERERERGGLIDSDHTILPTSSFSLQVFCLGPPSAS